MSDSGKKYGVGLRASDIVIILGLLIAGLRFTWGITGYLDLGFSDENEYMEQGLSHLPGFNNTRDSSLDAPLYEWWHFLLATVSNDTADLFYKNYIILTVLPALALYLVLRLRRVSLATAAASALFILVARVNFETLPKVCHFEVVALLAILALVAVPKRNSMGFAVLGVGCLIVSYARPEMFVAFLICTAICLALVFRDRAAANTVALLSLGGAFAASAVIGLPLRDDRGFRAFRQHYSLNWQSWTGDYSLSPWTDSKQIIKGSFGNASSIGEALRSNPDAVLHHIALNTVNLPRALAGFRLHTAIFEVLRIRPIMGYALLGLCVGWILFKTRATVVANARSAVRAQKRFLLGAAVIVAVSTASCLLIYPRGHYVFSLGTLLVMVAAVVMDPFRDTTPTCRFRMRMWRAELMGAVLFAAVALFAMPRITDAPSFASQPRPLANAVDFMRRLDNGKDIDLLTYNRYFGTYLPQNWGRPFCNYRWRCGNWTIIGTKEKSAPAGSELEYIPFDEFVVARKIDMILIDDGLLRDVRFRRDPQWKAFIEHPERLGFVKLDPADGTMKLYVRKAFLR